MSTVRVKLVIKRFPNSDVIGGAEASAKRLAGQLARRGNRVDVLSARYRPGWPREQRDLVDAPAVPEASRSIRIRRLPHPRVRVLGTLVYNASLAAALVRERDDYDAVLTTLASTETAAAAVAKVFTRKPLVCKLASTGRNGDIDGIARRWYGPLVLRLLRRVDRFVAVNHEAARDLEAAAVPLERIVSIPNGVDVAHFHPPAPRERHEARESLGVDPAESLILGVGRLKAEKSWSTLVESLSALQRSRRRWRAVILGDGPDRSVLVDQVRSRGIGARVTIASAREDVRPFLWAADVFVLPSLREGLSNAILEAMATGVACIASNVPGNAAVIEDGVDGVLVPPRDAAALGRAVTALVRDEPTRRAMGMRARETVERRYRIEAVAEMYASLLEALCHGADGKDPA